MSTEKTTPEVTVLFGLMAVRMGKVNTQQWEEAAAKTIAQATPDAATLDVGQHLVAQGAISPHDAATIQGMAAEAIRVHGGDTLAAINALASDLVHTVASSLFEDPHSAATIVQAAGLDPTARTLSLDAATIATDPGAAKTLATDPSFAETIATDPSAEQTVASSPGGNLSHAPTMMAGRRAGGAAPTILGAGPAGSARRSSGDTLPAVQEHEGRYEFVKELAAGGMGKLIIVHDQHLGRDIALKTLLPERLPGGTRTRTGAPTMEILTVPIIARFLQEARIAGQLEHPNIVPAYELGYRPDGSLYYTLRLVRGKSMQEALKEAKNLPERLKLLPSFLDVCNAVAFAHSRGVIHRDLKPLNVMIGEFGETLLIDWGIAKIKGAQDIHASDVVERARSLKIGDAEATAKTTYGQAMGSPFFMPPEQAAGKTDEVDERADNYSLGAMLYVFLTGHPPYHGMKVMEFLEKVQTFAPRPILEQEPEAPRELVAICERAMARKREDRYQSALDIRNELRNYIDGGLVGAYQYKLGELLRRWVKKHWKILSTAAAGIVAFSVLGVYSYFAVLEQRNEAQRQERIAATERDNAEKRLYFASTALAQRSVETNQTVAARTQLEAAPADYRNWEWGHFLQLANQDRMTLEIGGQYVALGPNNTIITGNDRGTLSVVDAKTGESKARLAELSGYGYAFSVSADGTRAAMNGPSGVQVWDLDSGTLLFSNSTKLEEGKRFPFMVSLSADGSVVAANQPDHVARVWNAVGGQLLGEAPAHLGGAYLNAAGTMAFVANIAPDTQSLGVTVLNVADASVLKQLDFGAGLSVKDAVFSPDGKLLAVPTDEALVLLDTATWSQPISSIAARFTKGDTVAFSADGKYLAAATKDGTVFRLNTADYQDTFFANVPHTAAVRSIAIAGDAGLLLTASEDRSLHLYDLATLDLIKRYPGHDASIFDVAVDPAGTRMASASFDGITKLWDLEANLNRLAYPRSGDQPVAFAQEAGRIALGTPRGVVLADAATERTLHVVAQAAGAQHIALSATGNLLAVDDPAKGKLALLDVSGEPTVKQEVDTLGKVSRVAITHAGDGVVLDGAAGLRTLDPATGELRPVDGAVAWALSPKAAHLAVELPGADAKQVKIAVLQVPGLTAVGEVQAVAGTQLLWGSDGAVLYLGSARADAKQTQGVLQRWDVATKALLPELLGHGQAISAVADATPYIATGSGDSTIILWDRATGQPLHTLKGHASKITALAFSPDASRLVSASFDGTFQLWDTAEGRTIGTLQSTGASSVDVALGDTRWFASFTPDGKTLATLSHPALPPFVLHAFPWEASAYGAAEEPLQPQVERLKRTL